MIFFLVIYLFICLLYYHFRKKSLIPICVILVLLVLLRNDNVGSDYIGYAAMIDSGHYNITWEDVKSFFHKYDYYDTLNYDVGAAREFGFSFYLSTLNGLINDAKLTLNLTVIFILCLYLYWFRKVCGRYNTLCLFIYVSSFLYFSAFNTLRQSLAISIFAGGYLSV